MNVLIFPGGMPAALGYQQKALERGEHCVGASSLAYDPAAATYAAWERLPWVGETGFASAVLAVLDRHQIGQIVSPHPAVAVHLRETLHAHGRRLPVLEAQSDGLVTERPTEILARAARMLAQPLRLQLSTQAQPALSAFEFAGLLRQASFIEGSTDDLKIEALCEIARWAPAGDVIEIGSAYGKSAFVLAWLAARHRLGPLLCVDPWDDELPLEHGATAAVREWARTLNRAEMFRACALALVPWTVSSGINYLRMTSDRAWELFGQNRFTVTSPEFGQTRYEGRCAILHVDGNHDVEWAARDIQTWGQLLQPGGWLIVDDYRWTFGSGPREAADAWLARKEHAVDCLFEAGSALFVRLKPE
jgi:SAM-dependent methyltransferase